MMEKEGLPISTERARIPAPKILIFRKHGEFSYFGEEDIIKKKPRGYFAFCSSDCDILTLDKIDFENIVRKEFPIIYQKLRKNLKKKEEIDYENKKKFLDIYRRFSEIDEERLLNTLTVADVQSFDEVPPLEVFLEAAKITHPIEVLLNSFNSEKESADEDSDFSEEGGQVSKDIDTLYNMLRSTVSLNRGHRGDQHRFAQRDAVQEELDGAT